MRTVQEVADKTLSSVPGFISTLGQSSHSPDGMGCRHVYWSSWEEHRPIQSLEKGAWSAMFPTYSPLIPMIPLCTYSPQPSVQIYLGYRHCTPIVVSPISASVGAPMVLKVVDAKKEKEKKNLYPLVAKGTAY
ncbi:hypothetical protein Acr_15g0019610 [Actinidia rufa]|uniref:Uncharacterized protein n=1 Tax=Actinidia rufa TaxID=165716 RepID=A0A7J0D711_9ERIC|nr:hypothetical protein Acr_00g0003000 [Actinidia rufa]GFS28649.1 hypothetical protein Acr_00g0003070 [Actinidia rufa]GFZ03352.1 hypothetical protein Acr_15g0019600 [Actinidia rufa]GFZ03353.1 hypothetical protein Acr_15g0019610 [Actinidia rufa]